VDELTAEWFAATFEQVKNWARWGDDDEAGALNLLTAERRLAAAASQIRTGRSVSCALDLEKDPGPDNPHPAHHFMIGAGDSARYSILPGFEQSTDYFGVACHGMNVTHIDALCHVFVDGVMYNGVPAGQVQSNGAQRNSLMSTTEGISGRAVLLDIPRVRGVEWLAPDARITPADLDRAEAELGVSVEPGDVLLISTGRARRRRAEGGGFIGEGFSGLHGTCVPWLRERDIAVLGSDGISDPLGGSMVAPWPVPIHQCLIAAMGVHLIDNVDLAALGDACAEENRWTCFLTIAPLRIPGATGCAVNPIALF
jgi:kynurenine formamidase